MNPNTFRKLLHAKRLIAGNYSRAFNLDEISQQVGLSKFHLSRKFKMVFGETMHQFHTRIRISKATKWVCKKDMEISDVAWKLGFPDLSTFSKFFKKWINLAPRNFKKYYTKEDQVFLDVQYRNAKESIIEISANVSEWNTEFGKSWLQSNLLSNASITRFFLVEDPLKLSNQQTSTFFQQSSAGVTVMLLAKSKLPIGWSKPDCDFILIDHKLIAARHQLDEKEFRVEWNFSAHNEINKLETLLGTIERECIPYEVPQNGLSKDQGFTIKERTAWY